MSTEIRIICPPNTILQGYTCVYNVPDNGIIGIELRCPENSVKDALRNVCIYTPQPLIISVDCPPNTERRGDVCVMRPYEIQYRCSDGSLPVDGYCVIRAEGSVTMRCPPGSRHIGNNICEAIPPEVRYVCPSMILLCSEKSKFFIEYPCLQMDNLHLITFVVSVLWMFLYRKL